MDTQNAMQDISSSEHEMPIFVPPKNGMTKRIIPLDAFFKFSIAHKLIKRYAR